MPCASYPASRLRRLRSNPTIRALVQENTLSLTDLVLPVFVSEGPGSRTEVALMPGVFRIPEHELGEEIQQIERDGISAVLLFGVVSSETKDCEGSDSWNPDGFLARIVRLAKNAAPNMVVIVDCCFCEYTIHGHCGVMQGETVLNDATVENLGKQAVTVARAGADIVAPSAMMDGQVAVMRATLDAAGFANVPIMAYSSKFASSLYGPFRDAAGSWIAGDRKAYQLDQANARQALRESLADEAEGADMLMVKPGLPYLDIVTKLRHDSLLPIVAYQVSGEYAMIKYAAIAGAINELQVVREVLVAFKRAGADLIISYFARDLARAGV